MEKEIKYKIRNLWRDRLLMSVASLVVLGFSGQQLRTLLAHRAIQPAWVLELSQAVRILATDSKSSQEQEYAISELQRISQARDLQITMLLPHLPWKNLKQQVERVQNWKLHQELARAHARVLVLERVQALELAQKQRQSNQEKTRFLVIKRDRALALERALALALARNKPLNQNLELELAQDLALVLDHNRDADKALIQGLEIKLVNNTLFVFIIAAELEQTHGFILQQGNNLEDLLSSEPNRARVLIKSILLLSSSLLILISLLVLLANYKSPLKLSRTAHLMAFLPEEAMAELCCLKQRLQQGKMSPWEIRKRLTHEFLILFFAYYIQVQLENLFLPSGDHNHIDD